MLKLSRPTLADERLRTPAQALSLLPEVWQQL